MDGLGRVNLYSDASGGFGCGAWWGHRWLQFVWPNQWGGEGGEVGNFARNFHIGFDPNYECH